MDGSKPETDSGLPADYSDRLSDLITSMIRLMGKTHIAIVLGAFVMGSAVLFSSWSNGNAIAGLQERIESVRCQCDLRSARAEASGNVVTVTPDGYWQQVHRVLAKRGEVHGDVLGTGGPTDAAERGDHGAAGAEDR